MTNEFPTQIPPEMREFAGRSVAQARKAFEGFIGAVQKTASGVDAAAGGAQMGVKDAGAKAVAFAEKSVTSAFDLAEKLVNAKDVQEVLALQTAYVQQQMAAVQEQARELGDGFFLWQDAPGERPGGHVHLVDVVAREGNRIVGHEGFR